MHIGEKIKELRLEKNMKQTDLAEKANVSRVAIGNYERCERQPTIDIVTKIANALEVSISYLVSSEETTLARESQEYEGFINYLESIGYKVGTEPGEVLKSYEQDEVDEDGNLVGKSNIIQEAVYTWKLTLDGKDSAIFTDEEFKEFQTAIKNSVNYHIWQKNKEK